ncbi:MAG: hypothetical protein VKI93_04840 [Synechococcus sp.]|nr:hypothetical protein [Synechococcus sp.]
MGRFSSSLPNGDIQEGYALLKLMEHLDRELEALNKRRIAAGASTKEGLRLGRVRMSHLRKLQDCISRLNAIGFNNWLVERRLA